MKKTIIIVSLLLLVACGKKEQAECISNLNCEDCNCIFDEMQRSVGDQARYDSLKACYEKNCKK